MKKSSYLLLLVYILQIIDEIQGQGIPNATVKFVSAPGFSVNGDVLILSTGKRNTITVKKGNNFTQIMNNGVTIKVEDGFLNIEGLEDGQYRDVDMESGRIQVRTNDFEITVTEEKRNENTFASSIISDDNRLIIAVSAGDLGMEINENGVTIKGIVSGLTPGLPGFHIHEKGDLGNGCNNTGRDFGSFYGNRGDLGNITADTKGIATININNNQTSLDPQSKNYIGNRTIVIHSGIDNPGSLIPGSTSSRVACGIIEI